MTTTKALVLDQLRKTYANDVVALKGISLSVDDGDFFALLGRNGAGKSTAINVIASLVEKTSGTVKIYDADIDHDFSRAKSYLGVVPQEINFSIFETCEQIVLNQAGYYGIPRKIAKERCEYYLDKLNLWQKRHQVTRTLSGGMKRRLMIARALVHEPKLLILDEPTAGVDIEIRQSMWDYLNRVNEAGTTIILTTHYLEEAENLCRNVAIIEGGEVLTNQPKEALLANMQRHSFVLDLNQSYEELPAALIAHDHIRITQLSQQSIEVEMDHTYSINRLFGLLDKHDIEVRSMRNKSNRLETLFLEMVAEKQ